MSGAQCPPILIDETTKTNADCPLPFTNFATPETDETERRRTVHAAWTCKMGEGKVEKGLSGGWLRRTVRDRLLQSPMSRSVRGLGLDRRTDSEINRDRSTQAASPCPLLTLLPSKCTNPSCESFDGKQHIGQAMTNAAFVDLRIELLPS